MNIFFIAGEIIVLQNRWLLCSFLFVGLAVPAFGQDAVDLKWKFEKGKTFYQKMTTDTKQEMTVMGMKINQTQKQTFVFSWTPAEEKEGKWTIKQKIEALQMEIQIGGTPINYDSTKETGAGNPLSDFFKALIGAEFTLTIDKDMKVSNIDGQEEFLKKLTNTNQNMETLLKQILSKEALKQMADPAFAVVPGKPVKKGDTWERQSKLNMGPIGSYESTYKYTYEGQDAKDKNIANIKVDTTLKYVPPGAGASSNLPFKIVSADLKSEGGAGNIKFDIEKGRVNSSDSTLKLKGKLSIDISGMVSEVELNQEQTTKVETSDTNPAAKAGDKPAEKPADKPADKKPG